MLCINVILKVTQHTSRNPFTITSVSVNNYNMCSLKSAFKFTNVQLCDTNFQQLNCPNSWAVEKETAILSLSDLDPFDL